MTASLILRWRGPPPPPEFSAWQQPPDSIATIIGPRGIDGGAQDVSAVVDVDVAAGTPLILSRSTAHFLKARADFKPLAFVAGLAREDTLAGFVAKAAVEELELDDWTAVTGAANLAPGNIYFLGSAGGLTTVPPSAPNCVTIVGWAASATAMIIDPGTPTQQ